MKGTVQRFSIGYLFGFITALSVIGFLLNTVPPTDWTVVVLGIAALSSAVFFLVTYLTGYLRRAALVSAAIGVWLLLRAIQLRDAFYPILLVLLLLSIEYGATKREKEDGPGRTP